MRFDGTRPIVLRIIHGKYEFILQRLKNKTGSRMTYFNITEQLKDGHINQRLKECILYYSTKMPYNQG
ncbi:MAG: hypothetical protein Q8858_02070 [Bacteroidota bacterium]|nr:hypothetical protein [Bacteroidota bacterium]MDP4197436.1 hypothetical protein [Bacteroidota bacterium]